MAADLEEIYERLYAYGEAQGFAGHDPFDGLNSVLFQLTPLKHVRFARLAWLQLIKRSPFDLRGLLRVPKGLNSKGLALFALAELSRFRARAAEIHAENARSLLDQLLETKIAGETNDGRRTAAFGYNFDWQSRHFYAPRGTPAIVPTAFSSQALVEGYNTLGEPRYLDDANAIGRFIVNDLNRPGETDDEICFSYTPIDNTIIYNASLLAGECLARVGIVTRDEEYLSLAAKAANYVARRQRQDRSWAYGANEQQAWVDSFHTAYVLVSLNRITKTVSDFECQIGDALVCGLDYWLKNFFLDDGTPKYYFDAVYPIDIHSCAVAIVALNELDEPDMAERVALWTIENMLDPQGYFYYQIAKSRVIKTPFMRWGQAWMAYALASLIEARARG
jgi:hypothetical protein